MQPQKQENIKLNWGNEKTWRTMNSTYTCANGRTLKPIEVKIQKSDGYRKEVTIYECETCQECPLRLKCTKAKEGNSKRLEVSKKLS